MNHLIKPIKSSSLKQEVVSYFENLILSGKLKSGERLPAERELAKLLEVSRPIVHEGLVELSVKGLVSIHPRKGAYINDYQKDGTLSVINSLLDHQSTEDLDPYIISNLLDFRMAVECFAAEKAAVNRSEEHLAELKGIIEKEKFLPRLSPEETALVDFSFHHTTASASGNLLLPLLMNSLKDIYLNILTRFYRSRETLSTIVDLHAQFVSSIERQEAEQARKIMGLILSYGAEELIKMVGTENSDDRS